MGTDKQIKKQLLYLKFLQETIKTKKQARAFLYSTGAYTKSGKLKKRWK